MHCLDLALRGLWPRQTSQYICPCVTSSRYLTCIYRLICICRRRNGRTVVPQYEYHRSCPFRLRMFHRSFRKHHFLQAVFEFLCFLVCFVLGRVNRRRFSQKHRSSKSCNTITMAVQHSLKVKQKSDLFFFKLYVRVKNLFFVPPVSSKFLSVYLRNIFVAANL